MGVLDELYSAKPAQLSNHTGPPGNIGLARFQTGGPIRLLRLVGLAYYIGLSKTSATASW